MGWVNLQTSPGGNVATSTGSGTSLAAGAFANAVGLGHIIIITAWGDTGGNVTAAQVTCADNAKPKTNSYVQEVFEGAANGPWTVVFAAVATQNPSSGNLNVTISAPSGGISICATEWAGGTTVTDGSSVNTAVNATPVCAAMSTTLAEDLILIVMGSASGSNPQTINTPTNFTDIGKEVNGVANIVGEGAYWLPKATVTNNAPTWNAMGANGWSTVQVALKSSTVIVPEPLNIYNSNQQPLIAPSGASVGLMGAPVGLKKKIFLPLPKEVREVAASRRKAA